jgi:metal-responsive CopG/Arc/MetJ family transcriptional regulator
LDATETKQISLTLPLAWVKAIDKKATGLKSRQDFIREAIEVYLKET